MAVHWMEKLLNSSCIHNGIMKYNSLFILNSGYQHPSFLSNEVTTTPSSTHPVKTLLLRFLLYILWSVCNLKMI